MKKITISLMFLLLCAVTATAQESSELVVFDHRCYIRNNPDRQLQQIINRHCFKQLDAFKQSH